ncbi:hypothetical protein [Streptomyces lanatus]|uniref:Ribosomal protein L7/L12 C-terminal domain-containing protein n=1 Tax=Streptomyces lanatus TaxID=66900 RepID=A0ABV1XRJ0_9ACTN|nr:hypothetical protein [Streptomyces lanatus]GHH04949.1 hypothetical protein GCM10018780_35930 [Streptomyces lanatus]
MDIAGFIIAFAALMVVAGLQGRLSRVDRRVARVERKLDLVLEHLGLVDDDPRMAEVMAHVRDGDQIKAIKRYREITGADLLEAKEAVERMA